MCVTILAFSSVAECGKSFVVWNIFLIFATTKVEINMNAVSMDNLWRYLQGLSLTASNRKWLAEKLIELPTGGVMTDAEIKDGLSDAFKQLDEVKKGCRQTRDAEELLYEL